MISIFIFWNRRTNYIYREPSCSKERMGHSLKLSLTVICRSYLKILLSFCSLVKHAFPHITIENYATNHSRIGWQLNILPTNLITHAYSHSYTIFIFHLLLSPQTLLLTQFSLIPSFDKKLHAQWMNEIIHQYPNSNGATVEVWKWVSNFIQNFIMAATTCPCLDWN